MTRRVSNMAPSTAPLDGSSAPRSFYGTVDSLQDCGRSRGPTALLILAAGVVGTVLYVGQECGPNFISVDSYN
jgi:hypothetical protein